jgi:hypothetical protein
LLYGNRIVYALFELMRGSFDMFTDLAGSLNNAGNELDPLLRDVVAAAPLGIRP